MNASVSWLKQQIKEAVLAPYIDPTSNNWVRPVWHLERLGSHYGGWTIPTGLLSSHSICYCIGVGDDITFDLALIERFGCSVFAYDPTPKAIEHVRKTTGAESRFHFSPIGVWDRNETVKFYAPANAEHVSHSALNLQHTDHYFEAECQTLLSLLKNNRHTRVDLLKLDIEGAEYRVLTSLAADHVRPDVLCVEFDEIHHPMDGDYTKRIRQAVEELRELEYELVAVSHGGYTFLRKWRVPSSDAIMQRVGEQAVAIARSGSAGVGVAALHDVQFL